MGGGPPEPAMPGMLPGVRIGKDKMTGPKEGKDGMPERGMPGGMPGMPGMMPGGSNPLREMIPATVKEKMETLDKKYNDLGKSGMRYTVTRSSEQTFDLTLTP